MHASPFAGGLGLWRSERRRAEGHHEGQSSKETRVFIVFPPVSVVQDASTILRPLWLRRCFPMSRLLGVPKKEGAGGLSSGPSFLAACGLGGPRDRPPSAADECRQLLAGL